MKVSVSRPVEEAKSDVEWPGVDRRNLRQLTLDGKPTPKKRKVTQTTLSFQPADQALQAPLSPSLRAAEAAPPPCAALPAVEPGQMRITGLARVSTR